MPRRSLFSRVRRNRFARQFRFAAKRQFADGQISEQQYNKCLASAKSSEIMAQTLDQLDTDDSALGGINWGNVFQWIIDNFPQILKIVMSIVVMFGEEGPSGDELDEKVENFPAPQEWFEE